MKFRKTNKIFYMQDFSMHKSIPSDIDFDISYNDNGILLTACGYGCLKQHNNRCYSNGKLFVPYCRMNYYTRKRFDCYVKHSQKI